jgi:bifunctional DNase/RNase
MKEMVVDSIMYDLVNKTPVVILKEVNGDRYLPILIGPYEAGAIEMGLKNIPFPRPMTHDLLNHILDRLQLSLEFIIITRIEDSTFFSSLVIFNDSEKIEIDARPSDAIALALRTKSPILVNEDILVKAGIPLKAMRREERSEQQEAPEEGPREPRRTGPDDVNQFRDFLNNVKPEDFFENLGEDDYGENTN